MACRSGAAAVSPIQSGSSKSAGTVKVQARQGCSALIELSPGLLWRCCVARTVGLSLGLSACVVAVCFVAVSSVRAVAMSACEDRYRAVNTVDLTASDIKPARDFD